MSQITEKKKSRSLARIVKNITQTLGCNHQPKFCHVRQNRQEWSMEHNPRHISIFLPDVSIFRFLQRPHQDSYQCHLRQGQTRQIAVARKQQIEVWHRDDRETLDPIVPCVNGLHGLWKVVDWESNHRLSCPILGRARNVCLEEEYIGRVLIRWRMEQPGMGSIQRLFRK